MKPQCGDHMSSEPKGFLLVTEFKLSVRFKANTTLISCIKSFSREFKIGDGVCV